MSKTTENQNSNIQMEEKNAICKKSILDEAKELVEQLTSTSADKVNEALNALETFLNQNSQVEEIRGYVADIRGVLPEVRTHDRSRTEILEILQELVEKLEEQEVAKKEREANIEAIRRVGNLLAENPEALLNLLQG